MRPPSENMLSRLREYQEGSAQVRRDHLVEGGHVSAGNRKERHDARTVNHHIGSAESVHRLFEKPLHVCGICHICLHSDALSACSLEIRDNCLCRGRFSRVVHDHRKSIFRQSFCDRASDSTRGAGDNRNLFMTFSFCQVALFFVPLPTRSQYAACENITQCIMLIFIMRVTQLRQADLNLLIVFTVLAEERNVTRAAARFFLSQPAVSRALQRLRRHVSR